jgi:cyclic pyranopterin phosphate synthase
LLEKLVDPYGRIINYLRLSVTEHCNLNCVYCRSEQQVCRAGVKEEVLTIQECLAIAEAAVELGMTRIRLTGGEPLVHPDILDIISGISRMDGLMDLSMTTNAVLLDSMAFKLAEAGLDRVNISLDSLDEETYRRITRGGKLYKTLNGIEKALQAGLTPVKINMLLLKGVNDHEIRRFVALTLDKELDVRFIEYMPFLGQENWQQYYLPLDRVMEIASAIAPLVPVKGEHGGPAKYYRLQGASGKIGLIPTLSRHICSVCNRLRVTPACTIKPCLFSADEIDLKPGLSDKEVLKEKFRAALKLKPDPARVYCSPYERVKQFQGKRFMTQIGG